MAMKRILWFALLGACLLTAPQAGRAAGVTSPLPVKSGTYALDKSHGKVTWSISHLGFSTYIGQFSDVAATLVLDPAAPEHSVLEATIQTASIGTLNTVLDEHLKAADFFNVAKFPTASFKATRITRTGPSTARVHGDFTLLGVTKPLTLQVVFNKAGTNPVAKDYVAGFTATAHLQRSLWGLTKFTPFLGDVVDLQIEGEFKLVK